MNRWIFFDLDGTLADTDGDIRRAWKLALGDLHLECPRFDELFIAGPPLDEMVRLLLPDQYSEELVAQIRSGFASHYDHDGFPATHEYPGVLAVVRQLKAEGRHVYIVTNKRYEGALAMARHFGWDQVFERIYASDMYRDQGLRFRKVELLAHVLEELGASPRESVLVGDTINDFEAARKNAVRSLAVTWGYGTEAEYLKADGICYNSREILERVR